MENEPGGAPAPAVDPAPAPNPDGGTPPADPGNGGGDPNPNPAPAAPAPNGDAHIQPGQAPTDLDIDAALSEIDAELEAEKAEEERLKQEEEAKNNPQPNADPNKPAVDPNKPAENPDDKKNEPPVNETFDATKPVDLNNAEAYFTANVPELGIAPIPEIRNPEQGETAADYYKNVTLPAIVQTVRNMTGFAQHNSQLETQAQAQEQVQRDLATVAEIDKLIDGKMMPAYTKDASGAVDPNSEGGKVIGEVMQMIAKHNADPANAANKITSFDHGFRALYQPAQAEAAKEQAKKDAENKRSAANGALGANRGGNGANGAPRVGTQHIRKGQSITSLDFDDILG